jgi:hypothetical protein
VNAESARPDDRNDSDQAQAASVPGGVSHGAPDEAEQSELDLGVISTGSPDIDRALAPIDRLGDQPVADHPDVYEQVLGQLSATMADSSADETAAGDA